MNIFDGKLHYLRGLNFYYSARESRISFYVAEIPGKKRGKTRIDMFKEKNHGRPHVHIGDHDASFALDDPSNPLCGECDNRTARQVQEWIEKHRDTLCELWTALQEGKNPEELDEIRDRINEAESY